MYEKIIIGGIIGTVGALLGVIITYFLTERRDRRKEFKNAAKEFYSAFIDILQRFEFGHVIDENAPFELLDALKEHERAMLLFRPRLRKKERCAFDKAWQDYYNCQHTASDTPREESVKYIKRLLSFAKFE